LDAWEFDDGFYKVQGAESEIIRIDFDNLIVYNTMQGLCSTENCPDAITEEGGWGTYDATKDTLLGGALPWLILPDGVNHSDLHQAVILKDDVGVYANITTEFDYTKFTIIEPNFSSLTESPFTFEDAPTQVILFESKSDVPPSVSDGETPNEVLGTSFNIPNKLKLYCDGQWNYETQVVNMIFKRGQDGTNKYHMCNGVTDSAGKSGLKQNGDKKSPWLGGQMTFAADALGTLGSLNSDGTSDVKDVTEFYFETVGDSPVKVKFGDGNPKGTPCV
jgi:hypothetical protein